MLESKIMLTKIALLGVACVLALVTSATAYKGMNSKGSCCNLSAMVSSGCCPSAVSSCQIDMATLAGIESQSECSNCGRSQSLPDDCCDKDCCADGLCCDGKDCDCCGGSSEKLISVLEETCASGCCSKK